jgi:hypothetical protein
VFHVRCELGFYIPDDILHSHRLKNLKSYKFCNNEDLNFSMSVAVRISKHALLNKLHIIGAVELRPSVNSKINGNSKYQNSPGEY